jgi:bifunctional non-homologous end joining protein LigD
LFSRNNREISGSYPDAAALPGEEGLVLDGELVALDDRGRPDFGRLQQRMHILRPTPTLLVEVPVRFVVFDVPRHGGGLALGSEASLKCVRVLNIGGYGPAPVKKNGSL